MKTWTRDELNRFGADEEIEIAPLGRDGTLRKAVRIGIISLGDDLYVRSAYGRGSAWFRAPGRTTKVKSRPRASKKT